jgi:hypothetical protein
MDNNPLFDSLRDFIEEQYRLVYMQDKNLLSDIEKSQELLRVNALHRKNKYERNRHELIFMQDVIYGRVRAGVDKKICLKMLNREFGTYYNLRQFDNLYEKAKHWDRNNEN